MQKLIIWKENQVFVTETITVEVGQTKTLTDSNNVLGQYVSFDKTVDGIRITHNKGRKYIKCYSK